MDKYQPRFNVHKDEKNSFRNDPVEDSIPIKDYSYTDPIKIKTKQKRPYKIITGVILLVVIIIGGFVVVNQKPGPSKIIKQPSKNVSKVTSSQAVSITPSGQPTTYNSTNFSLTVTYPNRWIISDTPSEMDMTSPITTLASDLNKEVEGKIIITVGPQGQFPSRLGNQSATAVLNSDLITYTNPTPAQDAQTYLSFLEYASTTNNNGLDGIYITGNYGYLVGQYITQANLGSIDPLVRITFEQCQNTKCTQIAPLTIASYSWNQQSFSKPLLDILESFQFS
ncbi:MAG: hypothetical protein M1554_02745 [Patescibacteria group bacterium]|jgi:hypothetical protein|nr:hypothetical protein [Patescibacteria group bacterium]